MDISDDIRAAILAEQCAERGHDFSLQNVITGHGMTSDNQVIMRLGCEGERAPHVTCSRCHTTWLVVEVPVYGYKNAEFELISRLQEGDSLRAVLIDRRRRRQEAEAAQAVQLEPIAPVTDTGADPAVDPDAEPLERGGDA